MVHYDGTYTHITHMGVSNRWNGIWNGMEYGMERWNGKWNGTVNIHSYS